MGYASFIIYLDSSQHPCSGNAEIQVGQHLCCGGFVDLRGPFPGEIIWENSQEQSS